MKTSTEINFKKQLQYVALSATLVLFYSNNSLADIYRFVNVDGIETFTDAPIDKDAQIVIRQKQKNTRKSSAQNISSQTPKKAAPSLKEIIEKTVQSQIAPQDQQIGDSLDPVLPVSGTITSGVGMRVDPIDGTWRHHNGIDIAVPTGTPVKAVATGTVVYSGLRSGYGWTVLIEHNNGMVTLYGHNSKNIAETGQAVQKGETISLAGSTGRSTGPHVHFEAWQSGSNMTAAFMPGSGVKIASNPFGGKARASFRKIILADGSMLITNIPTSIP
jgi:murein DD-endopeptidase MepM/ murein hydrolase activator NlpD